LKKTLLLALILISACSSQPKNTGDVYSLRKQAESQLDLGNKQADRGSLEIALILLDEAVRLAIAADDSGLRVRTRLSHSNVLFSLGREEEAMAGWNDALTEAERAGDAEWAAVCRVYIARGKLLSVDGRNAAISLRDEVQRAVGLIKDRFSVAFAWTVLGMAEKELGRYADAEAAARRSLEIHEKDLLFELAAYDWYMIASFRSLSGDYRGAVQALENAVIFDRRVENSWGLAADWRALGDVYRKTGESEASRAAYIRAAEIFRALGNEEAAKQTLSRLKNEKAAEQTLSRPENEEVAEQTLSRPENEEAEEQPLFRPEND
jgi:tetratricopeptide (TPR) repeat protein